MNTSTTARVTGTKLFRLLRQNSFALPTQGPKWRNFRLVCISTLGVCELALSVKLQESTNPRPCRERNKVRLCSTILVVFLGFQSSRSETGLKFPLRTDNKIRPGNGASQVTGLIYEEALSLAIPKKHSASCKFIFKLTDAGFHSQEVILQCVVLTT